MVGSIALFPAEQVESKIEQFYDLDRHAFGVREFPETVVGDLLGGEEGEFEPEINGFEVVRVLFQELVDHSRSACGVTVLKLVIVHFAQEMAVGIKALGPDIQQALAHGRIIGDCRILQSDLDEPFLVREPFETR